tara:strand:- start:1513 stop:1839 length:327 start_codon:yes stop_codon:yes gene_type:complete
MTVKTTSDENGVTTRALGIRSSFMVDHRCLANAVVFGCDISTEPTTIDMPVILSKIHRTSRRKLMMNVKCLAQKGGDTMLRDAKWEEIAGNAWNAAVAHASALVPELS